MKLIQVFALVLALVGSSFLSSCADDKEPQPVAESVAALDTLIQDLKKAEAEIAQGFLLRNATERNKAELKESIYNIKVAAYRLKMNPDDQGGLTQLFLAFSSYDRIKLLKEDETLLGDLKQTLRLTLDSFSQRQGVELDGIDRSLFTKSFDTELDPFAIYTVKGSADTAWKQTGYKEKRYAQAGPVTKDGLETWLLSPKLNLTSTRSPTLVIDQAIRGDNFASVVSVRVSADTVIGDPSKASWETLKINKLPDGSSFTFVTSEKIDLKRYEGKTIVVALVYNTGNEIKSSIQWEVGTVTLMGSGQLIQEALTLTVNPVLKNDPI